MYNYRRYIFLIFFFLWFVLFDYVEVYYMAPCVFKRLSDGQIVDWQEESPDDAQIRSGGLFIVPLIHTFEVHHKERSLRNNNNRLRLVNKF